MRVKKRLVVGPIIEKFTQSVRKNSLNISVAEPARLFAPEV